MIMGYPLIRFSLCSNNRSLRFSVRVTSVARTFYSTIGGYMGYLENNVVGTNETVIIKPQKNSMFLIFKWIWGILGCWLLLIPTIQAINATVKFKTTEYLITDKKLMEKYGWISTHTDEMPLSKVENIVVNYTFWGKILNYGTVSFQGTNHNHINFYYIKDAEALKKQVNDII